MIVAFVILLLFQIAGNVLEMYFGIPVPGPVIGMFLLVLSLMCFDGLAEKVRPTGLALISYLAVLFVPAGVGIMLHWQRITEEWLPITLSILISTILAMAVTAIVIHCSQKWLTRRSELKTHQRGKK